MESDRTAMRGKGKCPMCEWFFAVRKDGTLRTHGRPPCPGSHQRPRQDVAEALAELARQWQRDAYNQRYAIDNARRISLAEREGHRLAAAAIEKCSQQLRAVLADDEDTQPSPEPASADDGPIEASSRTVTTIKTTVFDSPATQPCPTCSPPTRRTVGMVCPDCGTDYAKEAE